MIVTVSRLRISADSEEISGFGAPHRSARVQNAGFRLSEALSRGCTRLGRVRTPRRRVAIHGLISSAIVLEVPNVTLPAEIRNFASVDGYDHGH